MLATAASRKPEPPTRRGSLGIGGFTKSAQKRGQNKMAKLRDVIPKDQWDRWQAESDAMSEEEREAHIKDAIAKLRNAISEPFSGFREQVEGVSARLNPPELPEFDSPFPKMLDVMIAMQVELTRANKAGKVAMRISIWTLIVAALALLTNLLPIQDWIARLSSS